MNKLVSKLLSAVLSLSIALLAPAKAFAQASDDSNVCQADVAFFFFNGVQTTEAQADKALDVLKSIHGTRATGTGDRVRYETLYNYSAGFEDFVETFEQRLSEQSGLLEGRFELFFEALHGGGAWWSSIVNTVSSAASILEGIADWYRAAAIRQLTTLLANPPTLANYAEHRTRIDNMILEGRKLLFVAHSQGNLFANSAYNYAVSQVGSDSVKVVHIGPASPTLSGPYTLANLDLVINGLRIVGTVPDITSNILGYLLRPPGVNGQTDILGHGLLEIYINQALDISQRVKGQINNALTTLIAPPVRATSGFFTTTLTWDGSGDVDLHTFEPGGAHVYFITKRSSAGFLDVDNTVANGPEHYYASCDKTKLLEGTYRVELANFARATGRMATVQIASWSDGVLGTKSVVLGDVTGQIPAYPMFSVVVKKNQETGHFTVKLQ